MTFNETQTQTLNLKLPTENEKEIVLTLKCVKCNTSKKFIISHALINLLKRNSRSISYQSQCIECGRMFKAEIGWSSSKIKH